MRVIKKINNNVAICIDSNDNELIAFGKGIGFPKIPYILDDIKKINRTYYGINHKYIALINEIPEDIFEISAIIVDYARSILSSELNNNIIFTLADHINFAVERYHKKINLKMPLSYDIEQFYKTEMVIGEKAIKYINKKMKIHLSEEEACSIALHLINAQNIKTLKDNEINEKEIIMDITKIVEEYFNIKIYKKGFNYSRFVSHMQYLLKRQKINNDILSDNSRLFITMKEEYKDTYECVLIIKNYLNDKLKLNCSDEELLYLMLHINRLCSREDCNK